MEQVKKINIKNRGYYFFDDIRNFRSNLLKIDKKNRIKTLISIILVTSRLRSLVIMKIFIA